ncbi:hypothetical protein CRG98_000310 [Punica granatum]|uniref:Uncharacterized protein n=1 Tax=Punica granatum TaxID=22663 RepID=A0A2I0LG27_PUNGR|nr:hypothetical protein CRG98_000310 [Punica granatum]
MGNVGPDCLGRASAGAEWAKRAAAGPSEWIANWAGLGWAGLGRRELGRLSYRWTGLGCCWTQAALLDTDRHELCPYGPKKNEPIRLMSSGETKEEQMRFGWLRAVREDRPEGESVELRVR